MIKLFLLTLILPFLFATTQTKKRSEPLVTLTASAGDWKAYGTENYLTVNVSLKNNSADTITYFSMSCSWDEFYTLNTEALRIMGHPCDKNIPEWYKIPPHQTINDDLLVKTTTGTKPGSLSFRVGIHFHQQQQVEENWTVLLKSIKSSDENIIWSNEIKL